VYANPIASFTSSPGNPTVDQTILFDATGSFDQDGPIISYSWNFGDGNTTVTDGPIIYHVYRSQGDFNVAVTVTDNHGGTDSILKVMQVNPKPIPNDDTSPNENNNNDNGNDDNTHTTIRDLSIENVSVAQREVQIGQTIDITVTVKNYGTSTETFNVTLVYGETEIGRKIVSLTPNTVLDLVFSWNTSELLPSESRLKAIAESIPDETNLSNNMVEGQIVKISSAKSQEQENPANTGLLGLAPYIALAIAATTGPFAIFALKKKKNGRRKLAGFDYIDKIFGGSIQKGSTIMALGKSGAGKSVLCQQLAHRLLNEQKGCVFVSYDELPSGVRERMKTFGWNVSKFEEENSFSFVDCYSSTAKVASEEKYFVGQPFSLTDLSIMISTALSEVSQKPKALFLDSATSLFTKVEVSRVMRFLQDRGAKIKANGDVFVFTLGKETVAPDFANRIEEAVDGIVELDFVEEKGKRLRRMRVKKLRGQEHLDKWVTFEVSMQKGISFLEQK